MLMLSKTGFDRFLNANLVGRKIHDPHYIKIYFWVDCFSDNFFTLNDSGSCEI